MVYKKRGRKERIGNMKNKWYIVAPGETIKELLIESNITKKELADMLDVSEEYITKVLVGQENITEEFAQKLEQHDMATQNFG